jgi:hypothetical protein
LKTAVTTIKSPVTAAKSNNDPSKNCNHRVIAFTFITMGTSSIQGEHHGERSAKEKQGSKET